jgi:hypothetical protein
MKLPQLTLRDLFWLVALVALGCGWWVERTRSQEQVRQLNNLLRENLLTSEGGGISVRTVDRNQP